MVSKANFSTKFINNNFLNNLNAEIADVAGVAEVTIRATYKEIVTHAKKIFPPDFVFVTSPTMLLQC